MGKSWSDDMTGYTPVEYAPPSAGMHLVEIVEAAPETTDKGNRITFTFKVIKGNEADDVNRTLKIWPYVVDGENKQTDGGKDWSRKQWFNLASALGIRLTKVDDFRALAASFVGKRLGVKSSLEKADPTRMNRKPGETDEEFMERASRTFNGSVDAMFPSEALGSSLDTAPAAATVNTESEATVVNDEEAPTAAVATTTGVDLSAIS